MFLQIFGFIYFLLTIVYLTLGIADYSLCKTLTFPGDEEKVRGAARKIIFCWASPLLFIAFVAKELPGVFKAAFAKK